MLHIVTVGFMVSDDVLIKADSLQTDVTHIHVDDHGERKLVKFQQQR